MTLPVPVQPPSRFQHLHLRRWFAQGLLISLPIGLTIYVVLWIGGWLNNLFEAPIKAIFGIDIPGLGLVLTLLTILGVGFLASHVLTAWIFDWMNKALARIPVLHSLYSTIQETVGLLFGGTTAPPRRLCGRFYSHELWRRRLHLPDSQRKNHPASGHDTPAGFTFCHGRWRRWWKNNSGKIGTRYPARSF